MIELDFIINAYPTPRERNKYGVLAHVSAADREKIIKHPTMASDFKHVKSFIESKVKEIQQKNIPQGN